MTELYLIRYFWLSGLRESLKPYAIVLVSSPTDSVDPVCKDARSARAFSVLELLREVLPGVVLRCLPVKIAEEVEVEFVIWSVSSFRVLFVLDLIVILVDVLFQFETGTSFSCISFVSLDAWKSSEIIKISQVKRLGGLQIEVKVIGDCQI